MKDTISNGPANLDQKSQNQSQQIKTNFENSTTAKPSDIPDFKSAEKTYLDSLKSASNETSQFGNQLDTQSEKNIKEFSQVAKLKFSPPAKMRFMKMDLSDDGFEGVYGRADNDQSGLAVIATERKPSEEEVKMFLNESSDDFPNLKNKNVSWSDQIQKFPSPEKSGLDEAKVWSGKDPQGNSFAAVLLIRSDGKGSYFFVYDHFGASGIDENDGYFDNVFSEVKAIEF